MSQRLGRGLSESSPHLSADAAHEAPQNCKDKCPGTKNSFYCFTTETEHYNTKR